MKTIFLLGTLLIPFAVSKPTMEFGVLTSFKMTPLSHDQKSIFTIECDANPRKLFDITLSIKNDLYKDGVDIFHQVFTSSGIYTFEYDNKFTRNQNELIIKYRVTQKTIKTDSIVLKLKSASKYKLLEEDDEVTSNLPILTYTPNNGWNNEEFTANFDGFHNFYVPDFYHKLNLLDFRIVPKSSCFNLLDFSARIEITNIDGVFGDIDGATDFATFYLKPKKENSFYSLELANPIYVNKESLKLSSTEKDGYVKTKHIFLPRNEMRNQESFLSYLILEKFGPSFDTIVHPFTFKALKNTVGDCQNSEYCVLKTRV